MSVEKDGEIDYNCTVNINGVPGVLWGKGVTRDARIDDLDRPSEVQTVKGTKSIVKASIFEIFLFKYFFVFLFSYLLSNMSSHSDSLIGFGLAGLIYLLSFWVRSKFSTQTMIIFLFSVFLLMFFLMLLLFDYDNISVDMIFNYVLQYLIFIIVFHTLFIDIFKGNYKKYYKIEGLYFQYLMINREKDDFSFKKGWFFFPLFALSISGLLIGGADAAVKYIESENVKKFTQKKIEKMDEKGSVVTYTKEHLQKLDSQVINEYYAPLHRNGVSGISRYITLGITTNTKYMRTNNDATLMAKSKIGVFDGPTFTARGFVKEGSYYFVKSGKMFKILDVKAD